MLLLLSLLLIFRPTRLVNPNQMKRHQALRSLTTDCLANFTRCSLLAIAVMFNQVLAKRTVSNASFMGRCQNTTMNMSFQERRRTHGLTLRSQYKELMRKMEMAYQINRVCYEQCC